MHRGRTRSTGALRVYTVVLTKRTRGKRAAEQDLGADLFVDGARELEDAPLARSRGFGDRVVLGADHLGRWPLHVAGPKALASAASAAAACAEPLGPASDHL